MLPDILDRHHPVDVVESIYRRDPPASPALAAQVSHLAPSDLGTPSDLRSPRHGGSSGTAARPSSPSPTGTRSSSTTRTWRRPGLHPLHHRPCRPQQCPEPAAGPPRGGGRLPLTGTETRLVMVLDDLGLTGLGHHHRRAHRGGRGGDPGRVRRPGPVRRPPVAGQPRRAVPARQPPRRLPGQDTDLRPGPARPAGGGPAGGLGGAAGHPGDGRQVHPPDHRR
jgi:hypothetical protein